MKITFTQVAHDFEKFNREDLERRIGGMVGFMLDDFPAHSARLLEVSVSDDSRVATFTVEVGRDSFPSARILLNRR